MQTTLRHCLAAMLFAAAAHAPAAPSADESRAAMAALPWKQGPATGALGDKATMAVPKEAALLGEDGSVKFMELTGNLPTPGYSIVAADGWFAAFSFSPVGYVKDDEKIDADALLKELKGQDGPSNEERRKRGLPELTTEGWYVPPHYDTATKHLEWGMKLRSGDSKEPIINYTVRLLGRTGYESVVLVSSPESLDADVQSFKTVLAGFNFNAGERYSEFKSGDRIAEFGLAALVAGGAAAVAAKTGFWKVMLAFLAASWKLVAAAGVAVLAGIGKVFKRKKGT
ncbi:MAG: DUF2167 domain-containing protein [Burkholderiaceae bacterium]